MTKKLGVFVKNASREPVVESLRVIKNKYLPKHKLITKSNQLSKGALRAISRHNESSDSYTLKSNDVSTYISASSISHLLDGWGYLSNAVDAYLKGNDGIAIHLAYYAELRAVMSLLASEGIGVFSNEHIGINSTGEFDLFLQHRRRVWSRKNSRYETKQNKLGTHVFAWEAFEKWCRSDVKPSYDLLRLFKVKGHSFSDLLPGFHPQASQLVSSSIAKNWLKSWAFDVKKYKNDRDLRNFVSYRPQTIKDFDNQLDFKASIENVYRLFQVLSPSSNNPFDYLDKLLLKALFEELYARPEIHPRGAFEELIEDSFAQVGTTLDLATQQIMLSGLPNNQSHLIFEEADKKTVEALPLISRAALLLRVSTGSASVLLDDAQIGMHELNFIWENYGFNNGFWKDPTPANEFMSLWSEIETDYSNISSGLLDVDNTPFEIRNEIEEDISKLTQFNRAALWGLAI